MQHSKFYDVIFKIFCYRLWCSKPVIRHFALFKNSSLKFMINKTYIHTNIYLTFINKSNFSVVVCSVHIHFTIFFCSDFAIFLEDISIVCSMKPLLDTIDFHIYVGMFLWNFTLYHLIFWAWNIFRVVSPTSRCPKSNTLGQWRRNQNDSLNLGLYYTLESFSFSIVVYYVLESKPTKAPARLCLRYFLKHCYA